MDEKQKTMGMAKEREVVILADILRDDVVFGALALEVISNEY